MHAERLALCAVSHRYIPRSVMNIQCTQAEKDCYRKFRVAVKLNVPKQWNRSTDIHS